MTTRRISIALYWLVASVTFVGAICRVFAGTPEEASMGIIQKIFYFHLPIAINTFLACTVVFIGGVGYLVQRQTWWDDLAAAAAKVAVVLCTSVLLTGMLWGHGAWGVWWTWSPRLTFSFMLWLLFVVYLVVRASIEGAQRRAVVSAVYGLIAYLDVPLVYLSARLLPDIHPGSVALSPAMKLTLALSFVPITMLSAGLVALQYGVYRARRAAATRRQAEESFDDQTSLAGGAV